MELAMRSIENVRDGKMGVWFEEDKEMINVCIATENMKKKAADARAAEIAKMLIAAGENKLETIVKATNLSIEEVTNLANETA